MHEPAVVVAHVNLVQIAGQRHLPPVRSTRVVQGIFGDNLLINRGGRCYWCRYPQLRHHPLR